MNCMNSVSNFKVVCKELPMCDHENGKTVTVKREVLKTYDSPSPLPKIQPAIKAFSCMVLQNLVLRDNVNNNLYKFGLTTEVYIP